MSKLKYHFNLFKKSENRKQSPSSLGRVTESNAVRLCFPYFYFLSLWERIEVRGKLKSLNLTALRMGKESGFSLTELLVVLVIIGILILLALPRLMPVVTKAKTTEAKINLKQVYMLQKSYKFENDKYSSNLEEIGYEQEKLITEGGNARYKIEITQTELNTFRATATAIVDFDNDGTFNIWEVAEDGVIRETIPD